MIFGYNDFLLEQVLQMINESEVVYSDKFRKLLKDIDSPIAKKLSEIEKKDINVSSNYFDISDNKDSITFISDRRAKEIIDQDNKKVILKNGSPLTHNINANGKIFDLLGYQPVGEKSYDPDEGEVGEIISKAVSPVTGKTFLRIKFSGGECVLNEERIEYDNNLKEVWSKHRQNIRVGRGIRAVLNANGDKFSDAEIEDFVNKYKSAFDRMNDIFRNFELVKGDEIGKWYSYKNYLHGHSRGPLSNSCMSDVPVTYFEIYIKNPHCCNLLILKDDEDPTKIKGRALVWFLDTPKDIVFMDRIYTHYDSDIQLFKDYAKFKKWVYKKYNDSSNTPLVVHPDGTEKEHNLFLVKLNQIDYDRFPYVDTLKYYDDSDYILSTEEDSDDKLLESTSGGWEGQECPRCGGDGRIDCGNCNGGRVDCYNCDGDGQVYDDCDECGGDGKVDCDECGGEGEIDGETCSDCEGRGKVLCDECDGKGEKTVDCPECDGYGRIDCEECDGDGRVDCPECNY